MPVSPPVTQTNPPFTTPPTWPFASTAERWETDYRLRLVENAVQYLWSNPAAINVVNYGADPTGVLDSTAAFTQATAAATSSPTAAGTVYVPPGTYIISSSFPTPQQSTGFVIYQGGGIDNTFLKSVGPSQLSLIQMRMPGAVFDMTVDLNGKGGNGIFMSGQFIGQQTINTNASGTAGQLVVTLGSVPNPLPPSNVAIPISVRGGTGGIPFVTPSFSGYAIFNGSTTWNLIANFQYPNGLLFTVTNVTMVWGTAVNFIDVFWIERVRAMNQGSQSQGFAVNIADGSFNYPFLIQRAFLRDVFMGPGYSAQQEQCNISGVQSIFIDNFNGDNTMPQCQTTVAMTGIPISSISCTPTTAHIPLDQTTGGTGTVIGVMDPTGVNKQQFIVSADVPVGSTTIPVNTATPTFNFPPGSTVIPGQGRGHFNMYAFDECFMDGVKLDLGIGGTVDSGVISCNKGGQTKITVHKLKMNNITNDGRAMNISANQFNAYSWEWYAGAVNCFPNISDVVGGGTYNFVNCNLQSGINSNGAPSQANPTGGNVPPTIRTINCSFGPDSALRGCIRAFGSVTHLVHSSNTDWSNSTGALFYGANSAQNYELHLHGGTFIYAAASPVSNQTPSILSDIGADVKGYFPLARAANYTLTAQDTGKPVVFTIAAATTATLPSAVLVGTGGPIFIISNALASTSALTLASVAGTLPVTTLAAGASIRLFSNGTNWCAA